MLDSYRIQSVLGNIQSYAQSERFTKHDFIEVLEVFAEAVRDGVYDLKEKETTDSESQKGVWLVESNN